MAQNSCKILICSVACVTMQGGGSTVRVVTLSIHSVCTLQAERQAVVKCACGTHILSEVLYAGEST